MKQTIHYLAFYGIGVLCILSSSFIFFTESEDQVHFDGVGLFTFSGCLPISYRLTYRGYQETPIYMMIQFLAITLMGIIIFVIQGIFRNSITMQALLFSVMLVSLLTVLLYLNARMEAEFAETISAWTKLPIAAEPRIFNCRNRKVFKLLKLP
ncbi:PREDICTED: uncharacterized protein LOC108559919 [Nicrophorus vespilloides]|uniref:Uncharacterized protein LOC108559919 n=1 Tax=Nicrophorus vespilloides TaxID=110193 RepID=A0ABM1MDZ7_NICVS|nr:PREDICTED: uncharacterized protein LOC108559919 [Nicrophorus vespilloides]